MSIKVEIDPRKKRRDIKNALGDNILKYITELVTNSDDSYKRLDDTENEYDEEKVIYIKLEKERRRNSGYLISVTDHAEGMTKDRMERIFRRYAGDNANGLNSHARGIFGQGASDVLKSAAGEKKTAKIESIKNGKVSRLIYNLDDNLDGLIDAHEIPVMGNQLKNLRCNLNIPNNGTKLSFGIPNTVKFTKTIISKLSESIEKYPYLRYLLNQPDRKVIYIYENEEHILSSSKYQFQEEDLLFNNDFSFYFENKEMQCHLMLYKNDNKSDDGTNIIVRDENYTVYDNTMFDFKNVSAAQNISGELVINDLYALCYKHLNQEHPDAIVYDNRTGFDTRHEFYLSLNKVIHPMIDEVLREVGKNAKTTNLNNNKKFNDALKKLNKYIKTELKDNIGGGNLKGKVAPKEGIKFARSNISITKGKKYDLKLLINSQIISNDETINIICNNTEFLEITPNMITFSDEESDDGLVVKNITIKGLELTNNSIVVQAKTNSRLSNVLVDVIEEDIHYPENGLDFYPNELSLVADKKHITKLYVDTSVIPVESEIMLSCDDLSLDKNSVIIDENYLLDDTIAVIDIISFGGEIDNVYTISANYNSIIANVKITIIEASKNENPGGGLIAGFRLESNPMFFQSYFDPNTHFIMINKKNPINIRIMGDMSNLNPENPKFNTEQSKYLCDIIATQTAKLIVKEQNIRNGEINFEDFETAIELIQDLIQEHKNKIYTEIYGAILGTAE